MTIITNPDEIQMFRLRTLLSGLKLELVGMHRRGRSCYSIIKEEFGLKGNKQKVYDQFRAICEAKANNRDSNK